MYKSQKLYKTDSKGKTRVWWVECTQNGYEVHHGLDGGVIQTTPTIISAGKNIGRSNETTKEEQAELEAKSKYSKQIDKGYTTSKTAQSSVLLPMLAHRYDKHKKKIEFPCYIQPKLDGIRCLASNTELLSRRNKRFNACSHILEAINDLSLDMNYTFDGELYTSSIDFQKICSAVKRDEASDLTAKVEYHIYDIIISGTFKERWDKVKGLLTDNFPLKIVETYLISNEKELFNYHNKFTSNGYEGSIIRNLHGLYELDKRSYHLQKVKDFMDEEFEIVGGKEDKDGGCTFLCKTKDGTEFGVRPMGELETRKGYLKSLDTLIGQYLTVEFFEWTNSDNPVPRFPIGKAIRNYE